MPCNANKNSFDTTEQLLIYKFIKENKIMCQRDLVRVDILVFITGSTKITIKHFINCYLKMCET